MGFWPAGNGEAAWYLVLVGAGGIMSNNNTQIVYDRKCSDASQIASFEAACVAAPVIDNILPKSGGVPGENVTIIGRNFGNTSRSVTLGTELIY